MFIDGKNDLNQSKAHKNSHIKGVLTLKRTTVFKTYVLQEIDSIDTIPTTQTFIIHSVFCLTTGPMPLPKWFLYIVRSRASSFK